MLAEDFASDTLRVADHDVADQPDLAKFSAPLSPTLTAELDGAGESLRVPADAILLAALGRTIARTIGDGVVAVDLAGQSRSVPLACCTARTTSATDMLAAVRRTLAAVHGEPHTTARRPSEICFSYGETVPGSGHALELLAYRSGGLMQLDWWYDNHRFYAYTVEEFTEQFPLALIELTSEGMPQSDTRRRERRRRRSGFAAVIRIDI
jgi:hypothetical protein